MKTSEEIENLKTQWKQDPCWDIEDTEGFEDHKDELIAFRVKHEEECRKSYEKRRQSVKERIYSLDLNETCRDGVAVYLKVPGGWIVSVEHIEGEKSRYTSCFVPFTEYK